MPKVKPIKSAILKNYVSEFGDAIFSSDGSILFCKMPEDLTNNDLIYFKYAPITTTDVERSFSRYKNLLCDNRRSFDFENLKKSFVVQCNNVSNIHI